MTTLTSQYGLDATCNPVLKRSSARLTLSDFHKFRKQQLTAAIAHFTPMLEESNKPFTYHKCINSLTNLIKLVK